jgi:CO dehydrogenase/acetyl-CoA synthase gamma subunit (corrinoid Fe-S protein)
LLSLMGNYTVLYNFQFTIFNEAPMFNDLIFKL